MNTRQFVISISGGLLTLVIVGLITFQIFRSKTEPQKDPTQKILRKVKSALVNYSTVETSVKSTGRVVSQQSVDVIAEVQGKILAGDISLKKGQDFKKGDVLVRLFDKDAAYTLQARKSAYLNAIANILPDLKIDYKEEYSTWVDFFEKVKIDEDLPELPEVNSSQLKIFLASRNILSEYYAIKSDEVRFDKYTISAPYNGAIQNVLLEVGSVANPGSRIAQIIKTSQLEVEIPVEVSAASWLRLGDQAVLKTEANDTVGKAYIKRISSFVDPATQSINVYLEVTRQYEKLFPGEYLRAEFAGMRINSVMEIPRNAVFNRNQVFTVVDGYLNKNEINLLKVNETSILFNGLPEGMEIITEPLANANESMQVQSDFTHPAPPDSLKNSVGLGKQKNQEDTIK
jgi:multidrug efflux pump subunit AcrA (membrane-fusion protein)